MCIRDSFYKRNGVRYRVAPYKISSRYTTPQLHELQRQFVAKLLAFIKAGHEVLFLDESQVMSWRKGLKGWSTQAQPIYHRLSSQRQAVSILGCISNKRPELCYTL